MHRPVVLILTAATLLLLAGCKATQGPESGASSTSAVLPNLVGEHLSKADDQAQSAGFTDVVSKDLRGHRMQILDGDWKVCTQSPVAGPTATTAKVVLGVIKNGETCPTLDHAGTPTTTPRASTAPTPAPKASATISAVPHPAPTQAAAATTSPAAVLLSPSGNYYRAGEYCPDADAGLTTLDAEGNTLTCVMESGRYHWHD